MPLQPPVTLIIPNYNGAKLLRENLPTVQTALSAYAGGGHLIVVDDGSKDESLEVLKTEFSDVECVIHPENRGFSEAIYSGVKAATNELLILLNSDVQPEPDFIAPLVARLQQADVFAVQSAIRVDQPEPHPYCLSRYVFRLGALKRLPTPDLGREGWMCLYASGGSMAVSRSKFLALGGFLPLLKPFYWEDFDLGLRAWRRGWETWLEPRSLVLHQEKGSIRDHVKKRRIRWALQRNKLLAEWIHYPCLSLLITAPPRILIRLLLRLISGDVGYVSALVSALSKFPEVLKIRREISSNASMGFRAVLRTIEDENAGHTELDRKGSRGCCGV
jgi:GT2 family glycosyltransferase